MNDYWYAIGALQQLIDDGERTQAEIIEDLDIKQEDLDEVDQ